MDTGRPDDGFATVLRTVADDPGVDLVAAYALIEPDSVDLVAAVQDADSRAPLVMAVGGLHSQVTEVRERLHKLGVPTVTGPSAAASAVRAVIADARAQRAVTAPAPVHAPAAPPAHGPLDEARAKEFLSTLGLRVPQGAVCADRAQARQALAELGGPAVVKILDAAIAHKTELGGVHVGVRTHAELEDALDALDAIGATRYLVEEMAQPGVELVVGARRDPVFGPIVLVGLGGTTAEALADVAIRVAPVSAVEAARMPRELAGHALLTGFRGAPVLDERELAAVVTALGGALVAIPELAEIEVNPLRVTDAGLVALDAVVTWQEAH